MTSRMARTKLLRAAAIGQRRQAKLFSFWKPSSPPELGMPESYQYYEVIEKSQKALPPRPPPKDSVPDGIALPTYALQEAKPGPGKATVDVEPPVIWTESEVEGIRTACRIARAVLRKVPELLSRCATTEELDRAVFKEVVHGHGAYPSLLGFEGFPKSVATSVNNVAVHGVPDSRLLLPGDVVSIDLAVYYRGFHGNCSETLLFHPNRDTSKDAAPGSTSEAPTVAERGKFRKNPGSMRLLSVAQECLYAGIGVCGPGVPFFRVGKAVAAKARDRGLKVVPNLVGHGIGTFLHGPPDVYHTLNSYPGSMAPGMVFTIEPCIVEGEPQIHILPDDGITVVTTDGARAAQFEHTVLITKTGVEILTI